MKTKHSVSFLLILIIMTSCASVEQNDGMNEKARMLYDTGVGYLNKGDTQQALDSFKQADRIDPKNPLIHHVIGITYFQMGVFESAEEYLLFAKEKMPEDPVIHNNLAGLYNAMGKYQLVLEESTAAIQNPDYRTPAAAFFNRGIAYMNLNQLENARMDLINAIRREPSFSRAHTKLGKVLLQERKYDEAVRALNTAIKLNDRDPEPYLLRGIAQWERGIITDAENDFALALRIAPQESDIASQAKDWLRKIR